METIRNTIAENFGGSSHKLVNKKHQFELDQVPDQTGKVAVITGGSEGIGYGCSHTLLSKNLKKLFILSLSQDVVDGAVKSLGDELGPAVAQKVTWLKCDMADWPAVTKCAAEIKSQTDRIDILINNAARGIMTYQLTDYGVDRHMAVNHIGHVVLTSHLLPLLKKTADAGNTVRIVCLGSNAHQATPSDCAFASLAELNQDLGPNALYGRAKLAQMLYCRWLARHVTPAHPRLLANSVHPGFVSTKMSKEDIHEPYPLAGYGMSVLMEAFKKDQFQGCVSAMFAATKTEASGQYICPPAIPEPGNELAQSVELGDRLMKLTTEIVKDKMASQSVEKGCPLKLD